MIKISKMSGKLKGIPAINTDTTSNAFCNLMQESDSICQKCYSMRMLKTFRKNCIPAFKRNSDILAHKVIHSDALPRFNALSVRFNGHGELINFKHYENLLNIARINPGTTFTLWTKRTNIVKGIPRPDNFILIYSNPKIDKVLKTKKGFDKVFNVVTKDSPKVNCKTDCMSCLKCYKRDDKTTTIIEVIK